MKKRRFIGWLAGAALMASMGSCSDDQNFIAPEEAVNPALEKYSTILLNVMPGSQALTRADIGEVSPLEVGESIYSIKVWAFLSAGQTARRTVHYTYIDENGNTGATYKDTQTPAQLQMEDFVNKPIAYVEYENTSGTTEYQQLQLSIPSVVLENFWKIDLYATCNSQSYLAKTTENPAGEITSHATREQIEAAVIKHDDSQEDADRKDPFGVTNPMRGPQSVASFKGVPMSYIQKNIDFYNEATQQSNIVYDYLENRYDFDRDYVQDIHLQHIVSKFRFVFTRSTGTVTNAEITKIELGLLNSDDDVIGGAFPTMEYQMPTMDSTNPNVMSTRATRIGDAYESGIITFENTDGTAILETTDIMETQDVYQYMATVDGAGNLYVNGEQMTAQQYDDLLIGASYDAENASSSPEGKELTMYGRTWIRETDKQLGGKIYYKINNDNVEHTATFQMAEAGDFSRNHLWIIYAYFEGGGLYVKPALLPWQHDEDTEAIEMETGVNINTTVYDDTWLKYTDLTTDPDTAYIAMSYSSEWAGTYDYTSLAISDNEVEYTGNPRTKTMNSPLMHVSYSTSRLIRMSRFAPHFLFLWVKATDANYDTDGNLTSVPTSGWKISRAISTNEAVSSGDIFFYVIPDKAFTPGVEARENIIVVSELSSASQLIPGNVGINNNVLLPGDITYIRFKYVTDYTEATTADYTIETVSSTTP